MISTVSFVWIRLLLQRESEDIMEKILKLLKSNTIKNIIYYVGNVGLRAIFSNSIIPQDIKRLFFQL